ncbi:MAG: thioredoxin family protein [Cytophagales bacterium]|nr:thioredoxin family protein [Cytophagales bacterium]
MIIGVQTDSELKKVLKDNEKVVIEYFADWCGHCRLLIPKFHKMSKEERFKDIMFVRVDTEEYPTAKFFLSKLGVDDIQDIPHISTFKNGVLLEEESTSDEKVILKMIEKLKGNHDEAHKHSKTC